MNTGSTDPVPFSPPFDLAETDRLLCTTRAVRKRLDFDRPVEPDVLLDCLRIAIQAPSGSNSQRWRWLVIDDPDKKQAIADHYRASFGPYREAGRALAESRGENPDGAVATSAAYLSDRLHEVPVMVIPCWLGRLPDNPSTTEIAGLFGSLVPAVWSFMLALRARGLGSTYTTLHLPFEREVGELLGIPDTVTQAALLPIAYTLGTDFKPAARRPIEEITYWNTWNEKR